MKKLAYLSVLLLALGLASMAMAEEVKKYPNAPIEARVVPSAATQVAEMNQAEEEPEGIGFTFTSTVRPDGWMGPLGYRTKNGPVVISELTQDLGRGFYVYMWNLTGLKEAGLDETDFNLGWAGDLTVAGVQLKADLGVGYWDLRNRFGSGGLQTDYWNVWAEVGQEFQLVESLKLSVYIRPEWVEPVKENSEFSEGGFQGAIGLRPEWKAGKFIFPLTLKGDVRAVYDSGLYGGESAWIGRVTAQASWRVLDNVSIILPGVDFSQPFAGNLEDGRGTEFVAFAGLTLSF